ncbi:cell wall-binding repeat-containing protein [Leifsonia sp. fls2-241-R2A-40a]|uniref:cell wall-binding repeat-containing protein n=1 Tax=Leifsonia sp. fls2-241-R2A-40a TaxID=3040290 RepID=UPI00254E05A5|nr:cell wall-binding repeat-containing protein [Leifsonia sp. fls2-241-R2A-40a]
MLLGGMRARTRALVTAVLAVAVVGGTLAVTAPASADDSPNAEAYYAAQARSAAAQPSDEQQNQYLAEGLAGSVQPFGAADADPSKFVDGDLVSDAVFYNGTAWSAATIQSLLTTKGSGCRATSEAVCLKDYTATTPAKAGGAACAALAAQTNATAAKIFAAVGAACGINPAVLVTMVQKEQGLVSTAAPTKWMYDHATGWNCPDVGADPNCDNTPTSTGFFNQVFGAAWQFKQYGIDSSYFDWFPVGKVSAVRYNLDASCGSKQVAVQNKATAALYYYTPYTPNAASLASYPGEGNACSAYGIRNFWMLFNAWYGSSTAGSVPATTRIAGGDRFETAAAISKAAYPTPGVNAVYIANGLNFPDALAAAPAAAKLGGPLLLVQTTAVPQVIMTELARLKPKHIYVAGGATVITQAVLQRLATVQPAITRIGGYDRFNTSVLIAKNAFGSSTTAYLASGLGFPDALSAGGAAGAKSQPVLLVNGALGSVDAGTLQGLKDLHVTTVKLVGGTTIISNGFQKSLTNAGFSVKRLSGSDRFATSIAVNADAFPSATNASFFASGTSFPDALAGAAWAGRAGGPLLVSPVGCVYPGAANLALRSKGIVLLGGVNALGGPVKALAVCQ